MTNRDVRFGLAVDSNNGHHVHLRLFAATGGQHLGCCGSLTMTAVEYATFRELLEPWLTDRSDPAPDDDEPEPGDTADEHDYDSELFATNE